MNLLQPHESHPPVGQGRIAPQRTAWTLHLREHGRGAGLVLPSCNTQAIGPPTSPRAQSATEVAPGAHDVLLLDQAGWHLSSQLVVPSNITILPLPPKCPELNPIENV